MFETVLLIADGQVIWFASNKFVIKTDYKNNYEYALYLILKHQSHLNFSRLPTTGTPRTLLVSSQTIDLHCEPSYNPADFMCELFFSLNS